MPHSHTALPGRYAALRSLALRRSWLERHLPAGFFLWAVLAGLSIAWVMPPWQNADEPNHMLRAVQVSMGGLLGERLGANAGGMSDPRVERSGAPLLYLWFHPENKLTASALRASEAVRWGRPALAYFDNTAAYPPFLYVPAVPAVWIGRLGHMHVAATLHLVRAFNAVAAAALGALALAIARRTRLAIAGVLLLPMSVSLAASASQDALMIPLAALAVALIDRARSPPAIPAQPRLVLGSAACLLLVALARPPYLALSVLLLLLPVSRRWLPWALLLAAGAITVLWSGYVAARISVPMHGAEPGRQAALVLRDPVAFAAAFAATWRNWWLLFARQMAGQLGWLDVTLPGGFIRAALWMLLLLLASAGTPDGVRQAWWRSRTALGLLAVAGAAVGVCLSIYLIWTPLGAGDIEGLQGRYFLPLLPVLALAMPSLGRWAEALRFPAMAGILALAVATPPVVLTALASRYYLVP